MEGKITETKKTNLFSAVGFWFRKNPNGKTDRLVFVLVSIAAILCTVRSLLAGSDALQSIMWGVFAVAIFGTGMGSIVEGHHRMTVVSLAVILIAISIFSIFLVFS